MKHYFHPWKWVNFFVGVGPCSCLILAQEANLRVFLLAIGLNCQPQGSLGQQSVGSGCTKCHVFHSNRPNVSFRKCPAASLLRVGADSPRTPYSVPPFPFSLFPSHYTRK